MAIVTDEYLAYDTDERFYYLTELGMIHYTEYNELVDLWNAPQRLKLQGRLLHQEYTKSAYNGKQLRYRHKDIIEYNIYLDGYGERDAIIRALVMFVEAVYDSDMDREILQGKPFPMNLLIPLIDSGVYFSGEYHYEVPEDEYRVDY
jgi:hypothetical protein